jgi:outer membrane protein
MNGTFTKRPLSRRQIETVVALLCALLALAIAARAQDNRETLTLDQAIQLALEHNRLIKHEVLEVAKAAERVEIARTRRRPEFEFNALALQPFTNLDFRFDRGVLGNIPGVGPFPLQDMRVGSGHQPFALLTARVSQPLTQLRRINLGIRLQEVNQELATNKLAAQRHAIANQVKRVYYAVLQTQSALTAIEDTLKLHRELDRVVGEYVVQKVALAADSLDVKMRLAADEYEAVKLKHALAAQQEQLNLLLGRDLRTSFNVVNVSENVLYELSLDAAQNHALYERAEVRTARLQQRQAGLQRRLRRAERLPDVSLTLGYFAPLGLSVLPQHVFGAGVSVKWEPFDWGRKRRETSEAEHNIAQADNALREAEAQVLLDVNTRFRKLEEARVLLRVVQAAQLAAQERLRVASNKFKQEAALLKDVLQTQSAVADTNHQYQQALLALLTARADFEKAIGQ